MGCLYCIEFPNGKKYIGITKHTAKWRFRNHLCNHRNGTLNNAIRKYGRENCKLTTLVIAADIIYLRDLETRAISALNTLRPHGYNSIAGGTGIIDPGTDCEAVRVKRMRETMSTPEYVAKQRRVQLVVWTPERRAARSAEIAAKWKDPEYRAKLESAHRGKKQSAETIKLRSASHINKWREPGHRELRIAQMKAGWIRRAERLEENASH